MSNKVIDLQEQEPSKAISVASQNSKSIYRQLPSQDYNFQSTPQQPTNNPNNTQNVFNNYSLSIYNNSLAVQTQDAIRNFLASQGQSEKAIINSLNLIGSLANIGTPSFQKSYAQKEPVKPKPVQEEKVGRVRRTNIPKTIIINRKTGEPVESERTIEGKGDYSIEHIEDREIVERINRMLIEGGWKYSSLLGKENRRCGELQGSKAPRDEQFPQVLALISPQMRNNFKIHGGCHFAHIVEGIHKVKMVHNAMSFGLTPTNSRYFIFGIFGLTKNLEPSLFGLGFITDKMFQFKRDQGYFQILKTFIEANNEELTQNRRQFQVKKKMLGRKIREPEVVTEDSFIFPQVLFFKIEAPFISACQRIKNEYGIHFEVVPSFSYRLWYMKQKFKRHQLKKQTAILQKGQQLIKKMIQTNNPKDIDQGIDWMNQHNEAYKSRFKQFELAKYCLRNFQKRFVGFNVFERYETPMIKFLTDLIVEKNAQTLKQFIEVTLIQQQTIKKKTQHEPYVDKFGLLKFNKRLQKLLFIVEPKVMHEIIDLFKYSLSVKCEKDLSSVTPRYLIGAGKGGKKLIVEFMHQMWKCECGFQAKIGVPCTHLFKVLHTQKGTKYEDYINSKHHKVRITGTVEIQ